MNDDMDAGTILTLLVVVLTIAGPAIEKMLKKAGKVDHARKVREIVDTFSPDRGDGPDNAPRPASVPESGPEPEAAETRSAFQVPSELLEGGYRSVRDIIRERQQKEAMKQTEPGPAPRLDIDPAKLVIYSEIMKPKWDSKS